MIELYILPWLEFYFICLGIATVIGTIIIFYECHKSKKEYEQKIKRFGKQQEKSKLDFEKNW